MRNGMAVELGLGCMKVLGELAMECDGQLARKAKSTIRETARDIYTPDESITHPKVMAIDQQASDQVAQEHVLHQLGVYRQIGFQIAELASRDITPPPVTSSRWQRLLGGSNG